MYFLSCFILKKDFLVSYNMVKKFRAYIVMIAILNLIDTK